MRWKANNLHRFTVDHGRYGAGYPLACDALGGTGYLARPR